MIQCDKMLFSKGENKIEWNQNWAKLHNP